LLSAVVGWSALRVSRHTFLLCQREPENPAS
jgi:hypothetical protein